MPSPDHKVDSLLELFRSLADREPVATAVLIRFQSEYAQLDSEERRTFFRRCLSRTELDKEKVLALLRDTLEEETDSTEEGTGSWSRRLTRLRREIESPRMRALRRFLNVSGGLKFLLDFRADVLAVERQSDPANPQDPDVEPLDEELAHLLNTWFRHGFLFLQEITPESPFRQIRFLKEHDLVHPMASLEEMGHRLGEDRRCFALYHRAMPEEPVVFIEAALTQGLASSIHEVLLGEDRPGRGEPDTAIFYSINNTQNGLTGLGLGKVLIFRVVEGLQEDHPDVRTFATLSPIPGFWPRYLRPLLEGRDDRFTLERAKLPDFFADKDRKALLARAQIGGETEKSDDPEGLARALLEIFQRPAWIEDESLTRHLEKALVDIAFHYLSQETNARGKPLNPVAGFHLGNGARLSRRNVRFGANRTERGLQDSLGLMVNYVYLTSWPRELQRAMLGLLPWKK